MPADLIPGVDVPAALLWDFDGTLVDSEKSWHVAERRLMAEWGGPPLTEALQRSMVGNALIDTSRTLMAWAGRTDLHNDAHYADALNTYALEDIAEVGADFRPGARELLDAARDAGVRCALVSASFTRVLRSVVDTLPEGSFQVVVGGDSVTRGKPDPEPYLFACAELGLSARDCLALEDSIPGTTSAERAGLATLAVPFEQDLEPGPRRALIPTLAGLSLAEVGRQWQALRDA